jgi:hypothetical protein
VPDFWVLNFGGLICMLILLEIIHRLFPIIVGFFSFKLVLLLDSGKI